MSHNSLESESNHEEITMMSILTTQTFVDDLNFFADHRSTSFAKRNTRVFKLVPLESKKFKKGFQEFCTGSSYIGEWNALGFAGQGAYIFPHGTEYEGRFNKVGQFHGLGTLTFPNGQKMHGVWKNGRLTEYAYIFSCGEELDENFMYCQMPDRRFHIEIQKFLGAPGQEYLTADQPTKQLPPGCYDTVDGIYSSKYKYIMSHDNFGNISEFVLSPQVEVCKTNLCDEFVFKGRVIREIPTMEKIKWIKENCRRAWEEPTGYRPELYEHWNAGRKHERLSHLSELKAAPIPKFYIKKEKEGAELVSFIKKVKKPSSNKFSSVFEVIRSVQSSYAV